jgi:uncharacterized protein DUF2846
MKTTLLILFFATCAHAQFIDNCKDQPDKATVYFYRVKESNGMRKGETGVTLNKVRLFQMPKATYVGFYLPPGKYDLTMGHHETDLSLNVEGGNRYFFQVSNTAAGFGQLQILKLVLENQARYQMKGLKSLDVGNVKSRAKERCGADG